MKTINNYILEALIKKDTKIKEPSSLDTYKTDMVNIILSIIKKDNTVKYSNELKAFINEHIDKWFEIVKYDDDEILSIVPFCSESTYNKLKKYLDEDILKEFRRWNHISKPGLFNVGKSVKALIPKDAVFIDSDDDPLYITYNNPNFYLQLNTGDLFFLKNINLG